MGTEIEIKLKIESHDPVRTRLRELGAVDHGYMLETNTFFDQPTETLRQSDRGLRLRIETPLLPPGTPPQPARATITYKGARQTSGLRAREEYNLKVDSPENATAILQALGYERTLSYEKKRHTYLLDHCEVVLDELPHFGLFLEIEGPAETIIRQVQQKLGLENLPAVTETYLHMIAGYLTTHQVADRTLTF